MNMRRSALVSVVLVVALLLAGCGSIEEKLYGSWKSETADPVTGQPIIVVMTQDSINVDGDIAKVKYNSVGLAVDAFDTVNQSSAFVASHIEKESVTLQGRYFPEKTKFVRISDDEAQKALAAKGQ